MIRKLLSVLIISLFSMTHLTNVLGQNGIVKVVSREMAVSEANSFLKRHKLDKLMVRWGLNEDEDTDVIGVLFIGDIKCYVVTSTNLIVTDMAEKKWLKNWAPEMVFYENESGRLERLNYLSPSIFRDVTTEDSDGKKAMQAYRHFLKRAKIDEKKLTRKQIAEIFIYGVAYGSLGYFSKAGWTGYEITATSDDYLDLLKKSAEAEENMSEEQKQLLDALERDNDDRWRYVIYAKTDIGYVKCSFQFKTSGKLKSVKIQQRRTFLPFTI